MIASETAPRPSRLGKGLSAIFADEDPVAPEQSGHPRTLPVGQIYPNKNQPRRNFDKTQLDELAASIKEKGILQPLLVRPHPDKSNAYEIVAGERRWRASQMAQLHEVPVIIRDIKDREALEFALIENMQRADLSPIEEAETFDSLIRSFGHTQEQLGEVLGKSRQYVNNTLRLLQLPDTVKELVRQGALSSGHARALISSPNPLQLANEVIKGGLSVRQTENLVKVNNAGSNTPVTSRGPRKGSPMARSQQAVSDANLQHLERDVSSWIGLRVQLKQESAGSGSLTIHYQTLDQLEDVLKRLSLPPKT